MNNMKRLLVGALPVCWFAITLWVLMWLSPVSGQDAENGSPEIAREIQQVSGWNLHIDKRLLRDQPTKTARAIELLQHQLEEIVRVVPAEAVKQLKLVPLYFSPAYPGEQPRAEFHPGAGWLRDHGRDPVMAQAIEFSNIEVFEQEVDRMPNFALHELAHSYHFRFLPSGFDNATVKNAFERAKAGGRYEQVERWFGSSKPTRVERSYALTNAMEYFAENSEAYFVRNDFFPFTREQLKAHDPAAIEMLEAVWGVTEK